ncbi:MAG: PAS domain-containing protein, partial [Bryobacteraceae bacterium]
MASLPKSAIWLAKNGPKELELLFRAIVYNPSAPVLITDNTGASIEASAGVGKLLGLPREKIIGRQIEEFIPAASKPQVSQLWRAFLERG